MKAGEPVFGCFMRHGDPGLAETLGYMGWDYLLFDGEHSPLSVRECEQLARISEITGCSAVVRVPSNMPWMIGQVFDAGISGVQVPMINHGKQPFVVERNMRIAQMVVMPVPPVELVEVDELDSTTRGEGGFGHTGR